MNRKTEKHLRETLGKNNVCYVLITCDATPDNGEMKVEMTYEGDAALASYLLQGAQTIIDEQNEASL